MQDEMIIYSGVYSEEDILPRMINFLEMAADKHGLLVFKTQERIDLVKKLIVRYKTRMITVAYFFSRKCSEDLARIIELYRSLEPNGYRFSGIFYGNTVTYSFIKTGVTNAK